MFAKPTTLSRILRVILILAVFALAGIFACEMMFADEKPASVTVATWNLEWFYDDDTRDNSTDLSKKQSSPDRAEWEWKKRVVAEAIAEIRPTILCLQEIENRDVVYRLRKQLEENHDLKYRYAFIDGYDFGTGQDVAILYQDGLVEYSRREQSREMFDSRKYYNLSKHLLARFEWGSGDQKESLLIFNCHLRAGADRADLRQRQCRLIHAWMNEEIISGANVIVTGDFNTQDDFGSETPGGGVAIVRGLSTETPQDNLLDAHRAIAADQRYTHISGRQFDRVFYSRSLAEDDPDRKDMVFSSATVRRDLAIRGSVDQNHWDGYYSIPQAERDISDHYPLVVEFVFR